MLHNTPIILHDRGVKMTGAMIFSKHSSRKLTLKECLLSYIPQPAVPAR